MQLWRKKLPKARKGAWFVPVRGSYLPATSQGWALYVPYVLYLLLTSLVVLSNATTVASMLPIVPYWVAGAVVMHWIASRKS
jgi:hypothetical protein